MTEEQLALFKIVILGNLDAEELGEARAADLLQFVENGGSLVLLGGPAPGARDGFAGDAAEGAAAGRAARAAKPVEGQFPLALTDAGAVPPGFCRRRALWDTVPPVLSVFPGAGRPPAARDAGHGGHARRGRSPSSWRSATGRARSWPSSPTRCGAGQLQPDIRPGRAYQRFWDQLLAWLSPGRGGNRAVPDGDLFADREQLFLGEEIELSARLGGRPARVERARVQCEIAGPDARRLPFAMTRQQVTSPAGKSFQGYSVKFTAQQPGLHTATALTEVAGRPVTSGPVLLCQALHPGVRAPAGQRGAAEDDRGPQRRQVRRDAGGAQRRALGAPARPARGGKRALRVPLETGRNHRLF